MSVVYGGCRDLPGRRPQTSVVLEVRPTGGAPQGDPRSMNVTPQVLQEGGTSVTPFVRVGGEEVTVPGHTGVHAPVDTGVPTSCRRPSFVRLHRTHQHWS